MNNFHFDEKMKRLQIMKNLPIVKMMNSFHFDEK
jgi:hypothetical protein